MEQTKPKAGLILTGGGARAAYQVGVLKAIRDLLPDQAKNPFPILCGTSAGAINAAVLAIHANHFRHGVGYLLEVWENFHVENVYHADPDRKSTRLNSSHLGISYAVFCLKKK